MNNTTIKGEVTVNGAQVKIETDNAQEFALIVKTIIGNTPTVLTIKDEVIKRYAPKGPSSSTEQKIYTKKEIIRNDNLGYKKWSEHDLVLVAKTALSHGPVQAGVGKKVYEILKQNGDVKDRGKINVEIFSDRVHRYLMTGNKRGLNDKTYKILTKHGFEPTIFSNKKQYLGFIGGQSFNSPKEA